MFQIETVSYTQVTAPHLKKPARVETKTVDQQTFFELSKRSSSVARVLNKDIGSVPGMQGSTTIAFLRAERDKQFRQKIGAEPGVAWTKKVRTKARLMEGSSIGTVHCQDGQPIKVLLTSANTPLWVELSVAILDALSELVTAEYRLRQADKPDAKVSTEVDDHQSLRDEIRGKAKLAIITRKSGVQYIRCRKLTAKKGTKRDMYMQQNDFDVDAAKRFCADEDVYTAPPAHRRGRPAGLRKVWTKSFLWEAQRGQGDNAVADDDSEHGMEASGQVDKDREGEQAENSNEDDQLVSTLLSSSDGRNSSLGTPSSSA